ncbi:MAG: hypothetical protein E7417_01230 [Ruminococcaceae bacterium]|nr:hypothetical protein [Oscillospiraceae bacterium]
MNKYFTKIEKDMQERYFPALKLSGVSGVIFDSDNVFRSSLSYANKYNLDAWVKVEKTTSENIAYMDYDSSGIVYEDSSVFYTSLDILKETAGSMPENSNVSGYIIKYPNFRGVIWDKSFAEDFYKEYSNYIEDYLYLLFEPYEKQAPFRYWYMENCQKFIYKKYISPILRWAKRVNINVCFDVGDEQTYFLQMEKGVFLLDLIEKGVSVYANHKKNCIYETGIIMSKYGKNCFLAASEPDDNLRDLDINVVSQSIPQTEGDIISKSHILLVRCERGVAERFAKYKNPLDDSNECAALDASFEGTYYCDMLYEKGFSFEVTSEKYFEKYTSYKNKVLTYKGVIVDQILLCKSCVFSKKGISILNRVSKDGICVNNISLIDILESSLLQGEE